MVHQDSPQPGPGDHLLAEDQAAAIRGASTSLTLAELADQAGVTRDQIASFWAALGMALPPENQKAFTPADVDAMIASTEVVDYGVLSEAAETALLKAVSHTAERLAWWQVESLLEDSVSRFGLDRDAARQVVLNRIGDLADLFESQMTYAWRRHLSEIIRWMGRGMANEIHSTPEPPGELPLQRAVGFADLVGYSEVSSGLDAANLTALLQSFLNLCRDIVTKGGGRMVKELGDGIMFATDDPARAAIIALELASTIGADKRIPKARVGLAWGRVLGRFGDMFGPPVNLASRLSERAEPGQVLVDRSIAALLDGQDHFKLRAHPVIQMPGLGQVHPYVLASLQAPT
ncbi:MAG: adenylate/guanylate cyclase domain-containing protein [Micrococcales bacterium]|nr:adenylate/guanylate cyclase domain-containing protein [Micrococcales bacterium]